ncbi:hemerythrin domain-containing protein [Actinoplanes sp. NPDC023714]|uniref:hemerythrin domain-containing protein n=1 Tax=Actinoplanes sp. NPDC023714 TaxID=3154322 RepID=UPI0033E0D9E0
MTENDNSRLVAWAYQMRAVHHRLREALHVANDSLRIDDLLLYCRGFCAALDGHHRAEDHTLFPAIEAAHPELRPVLQQLKQDHSMIAHLLGELSAAVRRSSAPEELRKHLEGVGAIMENHFRYEERRLLPVLETLNLTVPTEEAFGPL